MNAALPIKDYEDVKKFKQFYMERGEYRNYLLVTIGLNTALRVSDLLRLKWEDFFDLETGKFKIHLTLTEKKTGKHTTILINATIIKAFRLYMSKQGIKPHSGFIFISRGDKPITRMQAYRIVEAGGKSIGLKLSCHSLRKTFGYHAWKRGVPPVMLMKIFNHSTFEITKRYLCIDQEDKDLVFESMEL